MSEIEIIEPGDVAERQGVIFGSSDEGPQEAALSGGVAFVNGWLSDLAPREFEQLVSPAIGHVGDMFHALESKADMFRFFGRLGATDIATYVDLEGAAHFEVLRSAIWATLAQSRSLPDVARIQIAARYVESSRYSAHVGRYVDSDDNEWIVLLLELVESVLKSKYLMPPLTGFDADVFIDEPTTLSISVPSG